MINQVVLVGRLVKDVEVAIVENKEIAKIILAVPRHFKNQDGLYDTDFITCTLIGSVAKCTSDYCHKGDVISIRGRLQSTDNKLEVIAEKLTFLSTQSKDINDEIKKLELPEDDEKCALEDAQKLTDSKISKIEEITKKKNEDLMTI